jgi:hypothetical protein
MAGITQRTHDRVAVEADDIIGIITIAEYNIARYIGLTNKLNIKLLQLKSA